MKAKQLQALLATFKREGYVAPEVEIGSLVSDEYVKPEQRRAPAQRKPPARKPAPARADKETRGDVDPKLAGKHCRNHGHLAVLRHDCGAYLCHNCISGAKKCPICRRSLHGEKERPAKKETKSEYSFEEEPRHAPEELSEQELAEEREQKRDRSDDDIKEEYGRL
jgi:hypothetical protein